MSGCSLHEAFPDTATRSGQKAKREERAKAKKCQSPALAFLKATGDVDLDPDRQGLSPLPPAEKMGGGEQYAKKKMMQLMLKRKKQKKRIHQIKKFYLFFYSN
jgi:hypothetical protein